MKAFYYLELALIWVVVVCVIAALLLQFDVVPYSINWEYSFGTALANPSAWMLAVGITILLRPFAYKLIFKQKKSFNDIYAYMFLVLGAVGMIRFIVLHIREKAITEDLIEYQGHRVDGLNTVISGGEASKIRLPLSELSDEELVNVEKCALHFCFLGNQLMPVKIDDITRLDSMKYNERTIFCYFDIDVNVNEYTEDEIAEMLYDLKNQCGYDIKRILKNFENFGDVKPMYDLFENGAFRMTLVFKDLNKSEIGRVDFDYNDL